MAKFKLEDGTEVEAFTADEVTARLEHETSGLKSKLDELLGETKTAKQKAKELEEAQAAAEEARAKEKGEFKELYEREQKAKSELSEKYDQYAKKIQAKDIELSSSAIALELTRDTKRADLLKKEISQFARYSEDGVKFEMGGVEVDRAKVVAHITESYPFLVDGNQSSGGGAPGGKSGGGAAKGNLGGTKSERQAAIAARFPDLPK